MSGFSVQVCLALGTVYAGPRPGWLQDKVSCRIVCWTPRMLVWLAARSHCMKHWLLAEGC